MCSAPSAPPPAPVAAPIPVPVAPGDNDIVASGTSRKRALVGGRGGNILTKSLDQANIGKTLLGS
tara:strand:+ start:6496 stop:6690 length:195 start_codon:yes stop_codon:yes gene_type:complete